MQLCPLNTEEMPNRTKLDPPPPITSKSTMIAIYYIWILIISRKKNSIIQLKRAEMVVGGENWYSGGTTPLAGLIIRERDIEKAISDSGNHNLPEVELENLDVCVCYCENVCMCVCVGG